jgi:hypothetical protein
MKVQGRLIFEDLGAGAWMVEAEDGKRYQLLGVDTGGFKEGARVEIEGELDRGAVTTAMAGPVFRVKRWSVR